MSKYAQSKKIQECQCVRVCAVQVSSSECKMCSLMQERPRMSSPSMFKLVQVYAVQCSPSMSKYVQSDCLTILEDEDVYYFSHTLFVIVRVSVPVKQDCAGWTLVFFELMQNENLFWLMWSEEIWLLCKVLCSVLILCLAGEEEFSR